MEQIDWSKTLFRCSNLYNITVEAAGKSSMELYEDACRFHVEKQAAYDKLKKKDGVRGLGYLDAISKLEAMLPVLEAHKFDRKPLSIGTKTILAALYAQIKYGKWSPNKDIGSKHTEKGKECEEEALILVSGLDKKKLVKNEERIADEWFCGHPDAFEGPNVQNAEVIHDVKCPWDIESFMSYRTKDDLPAVYYWQMQGYMAISGATRAEVHFCLINTPEHQIKSAVEARWRRENIIDHASLRAIEIEEETRNNLTFDDMYLNHRRMVFPVERNDSDIEKARKQVERCREYLADFENRHILGHEYVKMMQNESFDSEEAVQENN